MNRVFITYLLIFSFVLSLALSVVFGLALLLLDGVIDGLTLSVVLRLAFLSKHQSEKIVKRSKNTEIS